MVLEILEAELKFEHKGCAIYAPNGVMKTSLAKTMVDLSEGNEPKDEVFPDTRKTHWEIIWGGKAIKQKEIFVVKPYDKDFSAKEISTLLANETLKNEYERVHKDIGDAKKDLDKKLRVLAGYGEKSRQDLDQIIERIFGKEYYTALLDLDDEIAKLLEEDFHNAKHKIIFNPTVVKFLESGDVKKNIRTFAQKYHELTEKSPILNKNFQHHNANQVHKNLEKNRFFDAGHSISLHNAENNTKENLETHGDLLNRIEEEKNRVFNNPGLEATFETFNKKITNKELQDFRDYITDNQHILPKLQDLESFEKKLWLQYIRKAVPEYATLIQEYKKGQKELDVILKKALDDKNDWNHVIDDFNQRFLYLPFELLVENKSDVILKGQAPSVAFSFKDGDDQRKYSSSDGLLKVLSTGEARALYILNIMFEVHTRWKNRKKTLFVFDDIVDSFDYKNKFAIIDYLDHITKSEDTNFLAIILTHNFDFLRTIESREICQSSQCYMALRNERNITLEPFEKRSDIRNPFHKWKDGLGKAEIQIAYIPFLRNVIEYTQGTQDDDYLKLTKMLHYKNDTEKLTMHDYKEIFEKFYKNTGFQNIDPKKGVLSYIIETADKCVTANDGINLEQKIVLSIASRILAEKFMVTKIRELDPDYNPAKKQMGNLLQNFKDKFNNLHDEIKLLKRINLITPANIHLNAFMYEPILDMGFGELKELYQATKKLACNGR